MKLLRRSGSSSTGNGNGNGNGNNAGKSSSSSSSSSKKPSQTAVAPTTPTTTKRKKLGLFGSPKKSSGKNKKNNAAEAPETPAGRKRRSNLRKSTLSSTPETVRESPAYSPSYYHDDIDENESTNSSHLLISVIPVTPSTDFKIRRHDHRREQQQQQGQQGQEENLSRNLLQQLDLATVDASPDGTEEGTELILPGSHSRDSPKHNLKVGAGQSVNATATATATATVTTKAVGAKAESKPEPATTTTINNSNSNSNSNGNSKEENQEEDEEAEQEDSSQGNKNDLSGDSVSVNVNDVSAQTTFSNASQSEQTPSDTALETQRETKADTSLQESRSNSKNNSKNKSNVVTRLLSTAFGRATEEDNDNDNAGTGMGMGIGIVGSSAVDQLARFNETMEELLPTACTSILLQHQPQRYTTRDDDSAEGSGDDSKSGADIWQDLLNVGYTLIYHKETSAGPNNHQQLNLSLAESTTKECENESKIEEHESWVGRTVTFSFRPGVFAGMASPTLNPPVLEWKTVVGGKSQSVEIHSVPISKIDAIGASPRGNSNNSSCSNNSSSNNNNNNSSSRPARDDANPSPGTTNPQWSEWYKTPLAAALGDVVEIRGKPRRGNPNDTSNGSNDGADCFFAITSTDGTVHLFESIRARDSRAIVKAIRWASARWSRLVIEGDATCLLAEFYNDSSPTREGECGAGSGSGFESRALSPTEAMNRLSHAFLDDVTGAS